MENQLSWYFFIQGGNIRKILSICLVLLFAATTAGADHVIDDSVNPQFLLVLSAESGSFDGETLTLTGVPSVVYFSDRPYRIAGHMSIQEFVELWGEGTDSYAMDPPNATLSILDNNGNNNIVFELIDFQNENDILTFHARVLIGNAPSFFGTTSLFVDVVSGAAAL